MVRFIAPYADGIGRVRMHPLFIICHLSSAFRSLSSVFSMVKVLGNWANNWEHLVSDCVYTFIAYRIQMNTGRAFAVVIA